MFEHVQFDSRVGPAPGARVMAGLAAAHAVAVALVLFDGSRATAIAYGGIVLVTAAPQALPRARAFEVACGVAAALVMAGGLLAAFGGGVLFWPAALPLILATTPLADSGTWWPQLVTAAVLAIPWVLLAVL